MQAITAREANQHFSKYLSAAAAGRSFQITKRGQVVACLSAAPTVGDAALAAAKRSSDAASVADWLSGYRFDMSGRAPFDRNALYD